MGDKPDKWRAIKTGFARQRQKVLAKVGQAEETKSPEYADEVNKVLALHKNMKKIFDNLEKYLEVMKAFSDEQEGFAQDILLLSEIGGPALQVANSMIGERVSMAEYIGKYMTSPIAGYLFQFQDLKARMQELETRRIDMDRYARDKAAIMSKSHPDPARVAHIEGKFNVTKDGYTSLFNEMMEDMPRLLADKGPFFDPMIAAYIKATASFYINSANSFDLVIPNVADINEENIHGHKPPITDIDKSARYRVYRNSTAISGTTSPESSMYQSPPSTPPPSTSGYTASTPTYTTQSSNFTPTAQQTQQPNQYSNVEPISMPNVIRARANFDFAAQEVGELSFKKGDILTILNNQGDWWEGELAGATGVLPSNYVAVL